MGRQLIDFSNFVPEKTIIRKDYSKPVEIRREPVDRFEDSVELLEKMFPGKLLFTVNEASKILNVSTDFIRDRFWDNRIP